MHGWGVFPDNKKYRMQKNMCKIALLYQNKNYY